MFWLCMSSMSRNVLFVTGKCRSQQWSTRWFISGTICFHWHSSAHKRYFYAPHTICSKVAVSVRPIPCNFCIILFSVRQCAGASGSWNSRVTETETLDFILPALWSPHNPDLTHEPPYSMVHDAIKAVPTSNQRRWRVTSCLSALCLHGTNLINERLTWQSGSGELDFTLALSQKAATLNTACPN